MSEDSVRGAQLARRHYASGDNAADRRADAMALSNKLRCEYEHRSLEQEPMFCARCGKELVRCLTKQDVTDCYYHRGKLRAARNSRRVGVPRWSCCQLGESATGCQSGGRHKYEAVHPTFDSWFDNWATATGQAIPRDQVRNAAVLGKDEARSVSSPSEERVMESHRLLPPRVRWVVTCQRVAWACCQHHRLGEGSPAFRLSPDLAAKASAMPAAPAQKEYDEVGRLCRQGPGASHPPAAATVQIKRVMNRFAARRLELEPTS